MFVRRFRRGGGQLRRIFGLFLDFGDLLSLSTRRADFHVQKNITNLTLNERSDVDVVLLAVIGEDQILERKFHFDPFVVRQRRPDVMSFRDRRFLRFENHCRSIVVHVQRLENQNQTREGGGRGDRLEPIVVQINHHHLRFGRFQDQIAEFLDFQTRFTRQWQFASLDDDVREIDAEEEEKIE